MEWVETTGRTVEEAKDAALDQLGVDEEDAEFEILEEAKLGLFGRLRAEARVRARVRPTTPRPKEERHHRRRRQSADEVSATKGGDGNGEEASGPLSGSGRAGGTAGKDHEPTSSRRDTAGSPEPTAPSEPSAPEVVTRAPGRSRRGRRGRGDRPARTDQQGRIEQNGDRQPAEASEMANDGGAGMDVALDQQGAVAREFLDGLVREMNLEADIAVVRPDEDTVEVNLNGPDLGLLIGPKGATLFALQDLTRTVVQRKTSASNGRLLIDVSEYRQKRKAALERFARQLAEDVNATGTRQALEPMNASDRKVVHDAINEIDGVSTTSEGEEPYRRVVILPSGA
jgi:spoIIIJ-associated protein